MDTPSLLAPSFDEMSAYEAWLESQRIWKELIAAHGKDSKEARDGKQVADAAFERLMDEHTWTGMRTIDAKR